MTNTQKRELNNATPRYSMVRVPVRIYRIASSAVSTTGHTGKTHPIKLRRILAMRNSLPPFSQKETPIPISKNIARMYGMASFNICHIAVSTAHTPLKAQHLKDNPATTHNCY
jgi:hypothetical protein